MGIENVTPLALALLRQVIEFVARERARTGKTYEEIFEDATAQIDANEAALIADLAKYDAPTGPDGPLPV